MILILLYSLFGTTTALKTKAFLAPLVLFEEQETSQGTTASGVETVGDSIVDLADDFDQVLTTIDAQLDDTINLLAQSTAALLSADIGDLEERLEDVEDESLEVTSSLADAVDSCEDYDTCTGCLTSSSCIWCTTDAECVEGDENGPADGECGEFDAEECSDFSCEDYETCQECLIDTNCGWCEEGDYCFGSSADNSGDCPEDSYYHGDNGDQCPGTEDDDSTIDNLEAELFELLQDADELEVRIADLEEEKDAILESAADAVAIENAVVDVVDELDGLAVAVDALAQQENQDEVDFQETLAEETVDDIVVETDTLVTASTDEIVVEVDESADEVIQELDATEDTLELAIEGLASDLEEIEETEEADSSDETEDTEDSTE